MEPKFVNLLRVILAEPQTDEHIRILALEIYDDGFGIRFVLPSGFGPGAQSAEEASINPMGYTSLTLRDDLGTAYTLVGGGSGSTPGGTSLGTTYFAPPIPDDAAWLDVFTIGGTVRFDLRKG